MVNEIGKLTQVKQNDLSTNQIGKNFNLNKNTLSESKSIGEDSVDISQERNLDFLRVEAGVLKNELAGIIANSLLKPLSEGIVKEDPLNSVLSRLVKPAKSILGSASVDTFSKEKLSSFQSAVKQLGSAVSKMTSSALLSPLNRNAEQSNALNGILNSISNELTGLDSSIQKKL
ncbi:MAG TPA: hypothetical protein QF468_04545 [Nitrospinota bacterium]|nr:hypothetical protein [Nitrospinota bacterium]